MTNPFKNSFAVGALSVLLQAAASAQQPPPPGGGAPPPGTPGTTGGERFRGPGMSGSEFGPPNDDSRTPGSDWSRPGNRSAVPGAPPSFTGSRSASGKVLPLNDVVSAVQSRFNATALKADAVQRAGQTTYRIRLLSADKSRMWTVDVDAVTGEIR